MLRWRSLSSVVLIGLLALLIAFKQTTVLYLLGMMFCLVAQWEFYTMQQRKGLEVFRKTGVCCGLLFLLVNYQLQMSSGPAAQMWHMLFLSTVWLTVIWVLSRIVFKRIKVNPASVAGLTLFGFFYLPFLFHFLLNVLLFKKPYGADSGVFLTVYLVAVTKVTDIGAYLIGSWIGKHQMSPQTSPKKTWEGFFGGMLVSLLMSLLLVYSCPGKLGILQGKHAVILGIILPMLSVIGDLAESVIKRDAAAKDSGAFIPGIGGALDLVDSMLFTAPLFYTYLLLFIL